MSNSKAKEQNYWNVIWGILLIIAAIDLTHEPVYTSMKTMMVYLGASIGFTIAISMGLIISTLLYGMLLVRKS